MSVHLQSGPMLASTRKQLEGPDLGNLQGTESRFPHYAATTQRLAVPPLY